MEPNGGLQLVALRPPGTPPVGLSPVQVEGEDVLLHLLLAHNVVKDGRDPVHRDAGVRHAEDPVELGCDESDARLLDGFSKKLLVHSQASNLPKKKDLDCHMSPH